MSSMSKLAMRQPVQELAFHKEQWEINGVQFVHMQASSNATNLRTKASCSMEST